MLKRIRTIRARILLWMILSIVLAVVTLGMSSIISVISGTKATLDQTLTQLAIMTAHRIEKDMESKLNIAIATGTVPRLTSDEYTMAQKQAIITERIEMFGFRWGGLLDTRGIDIFSGLDHSDKDFYQNAIQGNPCIGNPFYSDYDGSASMAFSAPLWQDGIRGSKVVGVVYFIPSTDYFSNMLEELQISASSGAYMMNSTGQVIAHDGSRPDMDGRNLIQTAQADPALAEYGLMLNRLASGETGFDYYFPPDGGDRLLAFSPIGNTQGWGVALDGPVSEFFDAAEATIVLTIVCIILFSAMGIVVAVILGNRIGNPIASCTARLEELAKGDLTSPMPEISTTTDETGRLAESTGIIVNNINSIIADLGIGLKAIAHGDFTPDTSVPEFYIGDYAPLAKSMYEILDGLSLAMSHVRTSGDQVAAGADQISSGAQALSQGSTEQASSVEELAATINEVTTQLKTNAKNALNASKTMELVGAEMALSNDKMNEMTHAMARINQSSTEIGKIIKTIEDIAFQTNILALNAAVEAARAGAAGKGFAVVADEVRNLASKSAEASQSTSSLIEGTLAAIDDGNRIAEETAQSLLEAVEESKNAISAVASVSATLQEQADSMSQITFGIDQISNVVQTNSATAQQSAAASEELSAQAQALKALVSSFKLREVSSTRKQELTLYS